MSSTDAEQIRDEAFSDSERFMREDRPEEALIALRRGWEDLNSTLKSLLEADCADVGDVEDVMNARDDIGRAGETFWRTFNDAISTEYEWVPDDIGPSSDFEW